MVDKLFITHINTTRIKNQDAPKNKLYYVDSCAGKRQDHERGQGLTETEANVAAKAGLIDPEQKYWWLGSWQEGERKAEQDEREGRSSGAFETTESLLTHLHKQRT